MRKCPVVAALLVLVFVVPSVASAQSDARGELLYSLCAQCHGPAAAGNPLYLAPAIAGLADWYVEAQLHKFKDGIRGSHVDDVAGLRMSAMSLMLQSDADVAAVAAYVAGLVPSKPESTLSGGDPERGEQFYAVCTACHMPDGKGTQQLNSPSLAYASDWYLFTQLSNFKAGIRGMRMDDLTGMQMRPMSMTLADEQAMLDVISYIMTLAD